MTTIVMIKKYKTGIKLMKIHNKFFSQLDSFKIRIVFISDHSKDPKNNM